jgi:hypothetical protein
MLVLGLAFFVPLFYWWGANIHVQPVAEVELDVDGTWVLPLNVRWELPLGEAESFRVGLEPWKSTSENPWPEKSDDKVWLRWPAQSLWSLIGLELIP